MEQSPSIRLIASDLDGTLLRDDRTISARTERALAHALAMGVTIVLVTARPPRFVRQLAQSLRLNGMAICCNGALVCDLATGEMVEHTPIPPENALALVHALRQAFPGVAFAIESGLTYGCEPAYLSLGSLSEPQGDLLADALTLCAHPVTKLIARHGAYTADAMFPLARRIAGKWAEVTYSSPRFIELAAPGIDKAWALAALCERLGVTQAEAVAFGDMPNDIPMLRWAGQGIAVANAHAEALAAADAITASNMQDGVALAIERLLRL